jgi:hypothetical protein
MRWVVRIEREDAGSESDAIRIERSRMEDAAGLGLTLEDGKREFWPINYESIAGRVAYAVSVRDLARSRTAGSG